MSTPTLKESVASDSKGQVKKSLSSDALLVTFLISTLTLLFFFFDLLLKPYTKVSFEYVNPCFFELLTYWRKENPSSSFSSLAAYLCSLLLLGVLLLVPRRVFDSCFKATPVTRAVVFILTGCGLLFFGAYTARWSAENEVNLWVHIPITALFLIILGRIQTAVWNRICMAASITVLLLALAPGLFCLYDFSSCDFERFLMVEHHYAFICGYADRFNIFHEPYRQLAPYYGIVFPAVLGAFQRHFEILQMSDYVVILRILNSIYVCLAAALYYVYARKNVFLASIAAIQLLPWYHFHSICLEVPNHSGWRVISMPAVLACLFLLKKTTLKKASFITGVLATLALLINQDVGIAIVAGLLAFLTFRYGLLGKEQIKNIVPASLYMLAGISASYAVFSILLYAALKDVLLPQEFFNLCINTKKVVDLRSRDGLLSPIIILMTIHSGIILLSCSLDKNKIQGFRVSLKAALSAMILVWSIYFVNQPMTWSLFTCFFLYGFLCIDLARAAIHAASFRKRFILPGALSVSLLALIVVPLFTLSCTMHWPYYRDGWHLILHGPAKDSKTVSGVPVKAEYADDILIKAQELKEAAKDKKILYLSSHDFLLPKLSGLYPPLPFLSFQTIFTRDEWSKAETLLKAGSYDKILIETATSKDTKLMPPVEHLYKVVKKDISDKYHLSSTKEGWEIFSAIGKGN